jgi:hypothetical protein
MPVFSFVIFLHLFAIEWGFDRGSGNDNSPLMIFIPFTFGILVVLTCAMDAARRGTPILHILKFVMLMSWPVSAPIYLIWSRGWRGLLWSMLWAFTLYVCFAVPAVWVMVLRSRAG